MYESSCSYAGALELKRSALKEEPWPAAEWPPYRLHQSTFEQLKQSVEKAKAALQDRSGLLGTATAFGDFYSGQLGQDANATLGFGRAARADESMLSSIDKAKNLGTDKLSSSIGKVYTTPTLSDTLRGSKCSGSISRVRLLSYFIGLTSCENKFTLKALELWSRSGGAVSTEELGRCAYKLVFQLLLLLETNNKMVVAVYQAALDNGGVEMSSTVNGVRAALAAAAAADVWTEGETAPPSPTLATPHDDHTLFTLMQRQRWGAALASVRERNAERILECGELPEDNVTSLLHIYCRALMHSHPEMVAMSRPAAELSQNLSSMMESLYRVSVALQRPDQ